MPVEVVLPRVDMAMEAGSIFAWKVKEGQAVKEGDLLFEISTDKANMEVEAPASGTIAGIAVPEGVEVPVGTVVAQIYTAGESVPEAAPQASPATERPRPDSRQPETAPAAPPEPPRAEAPPMVDEPRESPGKVRATPLARRLAREGGLALQDLAGTGPRGRIGGEDVRAALSRAPQPRQAALPPVSAPSVQGLFVRRWAPQGAERGVAVLLHGFSGNAATWDQVAKLLAAQGFAVHAPDLPGHGRTELEAPDLDAVLGPVADFLSGYDRPVHLVGHSMGGAVAARLASVPGLPVASLTLIAPIGLGSAIDAGFVQGMASADTPGAVAHLVRRLAVTPPAFGPKQYEALAAELGGRRRLIALADALVRGGVQAVDITHDLARVAAPARVIVGLEDKIVPWQDIAHLPPTVPAHLIARAGHMPQWDEPAVVAELIARAA